MQRGLGLLADGDAAAMADLGKTDDWLRRAALAIRNALLALTLL
jgi:hypothetical protein